MERAARPHPQVNQLRNQRRRALVAFFSATLVMGLPGNFPLLR